MKTILIVDDSAEIRQLVKLTLGNEDYQVLEAADGPRGVELAVSREPDLIIMDIILQGPMNGFEAISAIRQQPQLRERPVIILSGSGQQIPESQGFITTAVSYFRKPFSPLDLIEQIESALGIGA
jgi:CheY-like chemotaxis protein